VIEIFEYQGGPPPAYNEQFVAVYFGNITQNWYTCFTLGTGEASAPALSRQREAAWIVEQSQITYLNEVPRWGTQPSALVQPMARYGDVFFTGAVCGAWTGQDWDQWDYGSVGPMTNPLPNLGEENAILWEGEERSVNIYGTIIPPQGYQFHFPGEAHAYTPSGYTVRGGGNPEQGPAIITDYVWNYNTPALVLPAAQGELLPPLGPPWQSGLGYYAAGRDVPDGVAVSVGQLIDRGTIMCKYVYPLG
jgi:hypothetical protein